MMRRRIISAILLFIIILFSQAYFNQCTAAIPKAGQVIFIEGAVQIKRAGTNAWAKAEEFDALYNNDEIKTLKNSTAEIEFTHGDIVLISSSSHFKIQNYNVDKNQRTADFLLSIGKTWANVKKAKGKGSKFKINTPVGAASVRGTLFVVEVLPKDLTKPPTPENLEIAIAAIDGKIDVDTSFDKKIINPLKEVNFTHKDQKLNIQNIKQAYLKEAQNVIKIINQLQNKLMDESKTGEKIADLKKNTEQQVSIIDNTKIGTVINLIQQNNTLDSDNDGLPDALEIKLGYNPNNSDTDGNGKPDGEEDFDSDDILNKDESKWGYDPKVAQAKDLDTDEDSLPDILEINNFASYNTNPKLKNNLDIDNDNISNAFEVAQQNLGFPMDPFEKNLFSDRVDANYKTINANYGINSLKYIDIDKINDYLGNVNDNISAIKAGDGIGDFDEIILKDIIKGYYKIDDTKDSGKKLLLDPTYFNLAELVNRVKEYKTICQTQQNPWNDLDNYKLDDLYNPANWNFTLIKNLSKALGVLDESFKLFDEDGNSLFDPGTGKPIPLPAGKDYLNSRLTNRNEDISNLIFGIYKIMDPDSDYIKNCDEEYPLNHWHDPSDRNLNPLLKDGIDNWKDLMTIDKPIYIISFNNSLVAPFTGEFLVSNATMLTQYPNAKLLSSFEFTVGGLQKKCSNDKPMLKYPVPGTNTFIYICPRDPDLKGDITPPMQ